MGKSLVIVESPAKAKTINKILGAEYVVLSSVGHVRDLPVRTMGVDIEHNFEPEYVLMPGKKKVVDELKKHAKLSDRIYLAPDPDREGEAIAWHIREILKGANKDKPFLRVQYNEITPAAVRKAFENPGEINQPRVDAQQARRILDRIVGYMVSPMLWRRVRRGLSAGRVQSVALRLVCEREDEIRAFTPEKFWLLGARARKLEAPVNPFQLRLARINDEKAEIKSLELEQKVRAELQGRSLQVAEIVTREVSRRAPPPFITSSLQQAASSFLSFAPKRTMGIAQKLYEGVDLGDGPAGLITYMRTDSVSISGEAQQACRALIAESFGADYVPERPNVFKSRASAQEAHEAIRPTDVRRTPESLAHRLDPAELRLYKLIWDRFVASQMAPARIAQRQVKVHAAPPAGQSTLYVFQASASEMLFPGYMKVLGSSLLTARKEGGEEEEEDAQTLPPLTEGEALECLEWLTKEKETKPPARFSEASLIKALESNGIGRPSTYAQILSTLNDRKYIETQKRSLVPTDLGMEVFRLLVSMLDALFNVTFTAEMEHLLDEVEEGSVNWRRMLADFYQRFDGWMAGAKEPPADQAHVGRLLDLLAAFTAWKAPVKQGKRTFSHEKFTASLRKQWQEGKKPVSRRQLEALARIATEYREQIPDVATLLPEIGMADVLNAEPPPPATDACRRKMQIMAAVEMDEGGRKFLDSLQARVDGGRALSPAQTRVVDRMILRHAAVIPDFESVRAELQLAEGEPAGEDNESGPLLEAMQQVKEWKPAVARGRMVFDDQKFFESLSQQFSRRKMLSDRQRAALKKMLGRYSAQVADFEAIAERFGIVAKAKRREGGQE